jgi:MSHA biogenesis protein MshJ
MRHIGTIKENFSKHMRHLEEMVNARTLRERVLLFSAAILFVFILWRNLIVNYLAESTDQIITDKERVSTQINLIEMQIGTLSETIKNDSTLTLSRKLKYMTEENAKIKNQINEKMTSFIAAGNMIKVLKNLLSSEERIKIERIESLSDLPAFTEKSEFSFYKKGIQLEFESDFIDTVTFLKKLENNKVKILWDSLTYEVIRYPIAKITLVAHTLGTTEGWLHV